MRTWDLCPAFVAHGEPTRDGNTRHKKMQEALRQTSERETWPGKRQTRLRDPCATPREALSYTRSSKPQCKKLEIPEQKTCQPSRSLRIELKPKKFIWGSSREGTASSTATTRSDAGVTWLRASNRALPRADGGAGREAPSPRPRSEAEQG